MELASPPRWPASPFSHLAHLVRRPVARPCPAWTRFAWSAVRHTTRHTRVRARTATAYSGAAGHSPQLAAEAARHTMVTTISLHSCSPTPLRQYLCKSPFVCRATAAWASAVQSVMHQRFFGLPGPINSASELCCENWVPPPPHCLTHGQNRSHVFLSVAARV